MITAPVVAVLYKAAVSSLSYFSFILLCFHSCKVLSTFGSADARMSWPSAPMASPSSASTAWPQPRGRGGAPHPSWWLQRLWLQALQRPARKMFEQVFNLKFYLLNARLHACFSVESRDKILWLSKVDPENYVPCTR